MRVWGGQGYPNKHHEHFKVIFSITREEIELPVKIGDKNLNLTQPNDHNGYNGKNGYNSAIMASMTKMVFLPKGQGCGNHTASVSTLIGAAKRALCCLSGQNQ